MSSHKPSHTPSKPSHSDPLPRLYYFASTSTSSLQTFLRFSPAAAKCMRIHHRMIIREGIRVQDVAIHSKELELQERAKVLGLAIKDLSVYNGEFHLDMEAAKALGALRKVELELQLLKNERAVLEALGREWDEVETRRRIRGEAGVDDGSGSM